jgi:hypothetical protein
MQRRPSTRFRALASLAGALFLFASIPLGCGSQDPTGSGGSGGGTGGAGGLPDAGSQPTTVTLHPNAPPLAGESECTVVKVTGIAIPDAHHVAVCSSVDYATEPPSGGPHWPVWASRGKYTASIPRQLSTHNLEHGWVVLSYRCKSACPDVVAALEKAFDDAQDTYCVANGDGLSRVLLAPDPDLATPIALSAWGATYTATCIDPTSIAEFIAARIGRGTEMVCGGGQLPSLVTASCVGSSDGGVGGDGG